MLHEVSKIPTEDQTIVAVGIQIAAIRRPGDSARSLSMPAGQLQFGILSPMRLWLGRDQLRGQRWLSLTDIVNSPHRRSRTDKNRRCHPRTREQTSAR